ncbi:MAG: hypothetical protein CMP74_03910 [Flavobacteriales bacterium]|nr:hypothetical protein [Flavobacteriales bacterium]
MILRTIIKPIIDSFFKSIIGATLIVSGLIKANDTIGFSIKLSDYFQDGALAYRVQDLFGWSSFSLEWLIEYSLYLAIFICVLEVVLGFCLIVGSKIKETVFLLMSMLLFFLILTLHTATCGGGLSASGIQIQCVSDCGCFGDALKFTPWGSFTKDLVLIILLVISVIITFDLYKRKKNRPYKVSYLNSLFDDIFAVTFTFIFTLIWCVIISWYFPLVLISLFFIIYFFIKKYYSSEILIVLAISLVSLAFCYYTLNNLPIKDFRQYKIGTELKEDQLFNLDQNCFDCKPELINTNEPCYEELAADCVHPEACNYNPEWKNHPDYNSALPETWRCDFPKDHPLYKTGMKCECEKMPSVRKDFLNFKSVVLFISNDFNKSNKSVYKDLNLLMKNLNDNDIKSFYAFAGSPPSLFEKNNILEGNKFLFADEEMSKMMIRSNPGILLIQYGVITHKWHHNNMPDLREILKILKD